MQEAAFFDLDKTVIAKASIAAFAREFHREGMLNRRSLARAAWSQLVFVHLGASANRLKRMRRSVLTVTKGWEQAHVRRVVGEALTTIIDPITYTEATDLIEEHRRAGRRVYIVSAAPTEIVEPLARHLGVHEAIASHAVIDRDGRYTGHLERYTYGPVKAAVMRQLAERDGLDLTRSYAYTDSATDLPMLEAIGHPVAVNPDRPLRRIAQVRGWEIRRFEHFQVCSAPPAASRPGKARWPMPVAATLAAATATGGMAALILRHRGSRGGRRSRRRSIGAGVGARRLTWTANRLTEVFG